MNQVEDKKTGLFSILTASSVGTLIEWYDFYIFGSLATVISMQFFPSENPTLALLSTLATFAAGFVVRPFGALFFGRIGDVVGRKYTFLVTLVLMGLSTFLIGCIPNYQTIGYAAPILVLLLRLLQGLALGGEYGGAATYVAEHAPVGSRGFWTSWIQTTATIGLMLSLVVILGVKSYLTPEAFLRWGWRIPFWISIVMVAISLIIRLRMSESPLFLEAKKEGKLSKNPLRDSFTKRSHFKLVLLALLGATMGQGVVWYTGQFYALNFIQNTLKIEVGQSSEIMMWALLLATPFFIFFGWLSDKIGRKGIMITGMLLAVIGYRPLYDAMVEIASTDVLYQNDFLVLSKHGFWKMVFFIFIQVFFVTMVYGPIAAFLVELFPTSIRYTSMSLPYHVGNGIFGGLLPAIALYLTTSASVANEKARVLGQALAYEKPYLEGLWYPIGIASISFIIGLLYLQTKPSKWLTKLQRYLGVVWILFGLLAGIYLIGSQAIPKFNSGIAADRIPAIIYAFVLSPLVSGSFILFGYYALLGEYGSNTLMNEEE
ncbi:MAG: MFS transporter [Flavobacteriales bacterium]